MQRDGNLVVYSKTNKPCWASHTMGRGQKLRLWETGEFTVYGASNNREWTSRDIAGGRIKLPIWKPGMTLFDGCESRPLWSQAYGQGNTFKDTYKSYYIDSL